MNWEYLHLISHPFAIVLPIAGAAVGLVGWALGRDELERWGVLAVLLGAVFAIPSYFSGIAAADDVAQRTFITPSIVQTHRTWATWAAVALATAGIFAGYSIFQPRESRLRRFVLLVAAGAALLTGFAAYRGGLIEHGEAQDAAEDAAAAQAERAGDDPAIDTGSAHDPAVPSDAALDTSPPKQDAEP